MAYEREIIQAIDRQSWLDTISKKIQPAILNLYRSGGETGQKVADFLHGVWLGHPLHAVLTDVPMGAYTAGLVMDGLEMATGEEGFGKGADAALTLGAIGAAGAASAGLTDWMHTDDTPRRVGMLHAMLNVTALSLYIASLASRKGRKRQAGWGLALLGYAVTTAAAYLGGHLAYGEKVGVNHAPDPEELPEKYTPVMALEDLAEGELAKADANGIPILLVRRGRTIYALAETCSHMGGPLSEGKLVGDSVVCPWHGSRFGLEDGRNINGPSAYAQPCLQTRIRNGQVEVRASPQDVY